MRTDDEVAPFSSGRGAYGLRIDLHGTEELLGPAPDGWKPWELRTATEAEPPEGFGDVDGLPADDRTIALSPGGASKRIAGGGFMTIDRFRRRTTYHLASPVSNAVLIHPLLATTAGVVAVWEGLYAFHAGAFVAAGQAWAICGEKGAGKSSMLAALGSLGTGVLSDDAVIVSGGKCLAGPRAVDLRGPTASLFSDPELLGVIGGRERWRVRLASIPGEVPLAGWVTLDWGRPMVTSVSAVERGALLIESLGVRTAPADPQGLLDLAALPMIRFTRPKALNRLFTSAEALLRAVA